MRPRRLEIPVVGTQESEHVYMIGCTANSLVKIGRSVDVARRLADIQRMSPVQLRVLWQLAGGYELESHLHGAFRSLRSHGEWFDFEGLDPVAEVNGALAWWYELSELRMPEKYEEAPDFREFTLVSIDAENWGGPLVGAIRSVTTRGSDDQPWYWVGDSATRETPTFLFAADEFTLIEAPTDQERRDASAWEWWLPSLKWRESFRPAAYALWMDYW